jgi:dynein intermediate chain
MADAARSQRQSALEEKKKRLEELKARRQQRTTNNASTQDAANAKIAASTNLDDYIEGLLNVPATAASSQPTAVGAISTNSEMISPMGASAPTENGSINTDSKKSEPMSSSSSEKIADASIPNRHNLTQLPKTETFEMGTQTASDEFPTKNDFDIEDDQQPSPAGDESEDPNFAEGTKSNKLPEDEEILEEAAKVLSTEEIEKELSSEAFSSFLNITSKKVERALGSDLLANLLVDYDGGMDEKEKDSTKMSDGSRFLASRQMYECPKWTASRDVTDMDWSPLHRELMLCGYHMPSSTSSLGQPIGSSAVKVVSPDDTPSDSLTPRNGELLSDGLALIWNLAMPNRPEHIFTCGSPITTTRFHPTESALIIGGCQSGQVVVWDVRAGRMPVQKSILTTTANGNSKGHTHPICAMEVIEGGVSFFLFFLHYELNSQNDTFFFCV